MGVQAKVVFVAEDIQSLFDLTDEQAEEWFNNNRKSIEDAMTRYGWEAIETLGQMDNLKEREQ